MSEQENLNYKRVAASIAYIKEHFKEQPLLNVVAEKVHLSPFHFQRIFKEWAGVSPKKFLQYISIEHAKKVLKETNSSLFETAIATGLSGTGRLHDLFVKIEGMTPGEYKNGGELLNINYSYGQSPFGQIILAATKKGLCHVAFITNKKQALSTLKKRFPKAAYRQQNDSFQTNALLIFDNEPRTIPEIKIHIKGTDFQLKVWDALLKIPNGHLTSYGTIAKNIYKPKASRAVGTAIGKNPVAFLIPCHRVIQASGSIGAYMWGSTRKTAIIGWEAVKNDTNS